MLGNYPGGERMTTTVSLNNADGVRDACSDPYFLSGRQNVTLNTPDGLERVFELYSPWRYRYLWTR